MFSFLAATRWNHVFKLTVGSVKDEDLEWKASGKIRPNFENFQSNPNGISQRLQHVSLHVRRELGLHRLSGRTPLSLSLSHTHTLLSYFDRVSSIKCYVFSFVKSTQDVCMGVYICIYVYVFRGYHRYQRPGISYP